MSLVAFDPGISTGCAIHTDERYHVANGQTVVTPRQYITLVITEPHKLWEVLEGQNPVHCCIFENFASGGLISKDGQATLRLVGAIEAICYKMGIPVALQFPVERRGFIPIAREMLKQRGSTPISHEVDALSHLLLYESRIEKGIQDVYATRRRRTYS